MASVVWFVDELRPDGDSTFRGLFEDLSVVEAHAHNRGFVRGSEFGPKYVEYVHPETHHVIQAELLGSEVWVEMDDFQ